MDSQFTLKLCQKPYEDPFGAFLRQFANGLQNNAHGNRSKKDACALDANYVFPNSYACLEKFEQERNNLVRLGLAPDCFRYTDQGWVAVYRPSEGAPYCVPVLPRGHFAEQQALATSLSARARGAIPPPSSRNISPDDLPIEQLAMEAGACAMPLPDVAPSKHKHPSHLPADATAETLASALNGDEFYARAFGLPRCIRVTRRSQSQDLFFLVEADWDRPPKEVRIKMLYRRPVIVVGTNDGSRDESVAWLTGHIPLQRNPSPQALEQYRNAKQTAKTTPDYTPGSITYLETPSPGALVAFQKFTFPASSGLETRRLIQTVLDFEKAIISKTLLAAQSEVLQYQDAEGLAIIITCEDQDDQVERAEEVVVAAGFFDGPHSRLENLGEGGGNG